MADGQVQLGNTSINLRSNRQVSDTQVNSRHAGNGFKPYSDISPLFEDSYDGQKKPVPFRCLFC